MLAECQWGVARKRAQWIFGVSLRPPRAFDPSPILSSCLMRDTVECAFRLSSKSHGVGTRRSVCMSRSTISTTTHLISKYSRAYSTNPTGSQNRDGEWQHFSNPILKVVLDVRRSEAGDRLESFRLRVLWNMNAEGDAMDVDQREFVFVRRVSVAHDQ